MPRKNAKQQLTLMADYLDVSNPTVRKITVGISRRYAMQIGAKPTKRGGPLFFRGREIECHPKKRKGSIEHDTQAEIGS